MRRKNFCVALISLSECDLGVKSLSSFLKSNGIKTKIFFLDTAETRYNKETIKQLKELVRDSDLICLSVVNFSFNKAIQVTKELRKLKKPIVWGGQIVTVAPEMCLKYNDIICLGEGEKALLELIEKIQKKENIYHTKNFWFKNKNKIIRNDLRPLIGCLDEMPFPDLKSKNFYLKGNKISPSKKVFFKFRGMNSVPVYFSRGCRGNCSYCSNPIFRKKYEGKGTFDRKNSVKKIIEWLSSLKKNNKALEFILFFDEDFFSRTEKEINEFSEKYKRKINLPFYVVASPSQLTEDKLKALISCGLKEVYLGVQTGSDYVNKEIYYRPLDLKKQILKAALILNKHKNRLFAPSYSLIINNPWESKEDLLETINLLVELPKPFIATIHNLMFIPGTVLHKRALNEKIIYKKNELGIGANWKDKPSFSEQKKNRYLNSLLYFMNGPCTEKNLGVIKLKDIPIYLNEKVIKEAEKERKQLKYIDFFSVKGNTVVPTMPKSIQKIHSKN